MRPALLAALALGLPFLASGPAAAEQVRICARNGSGIAASATIEFVNGSGGVVSTTRSGTIARDRSVCAHGSKVAATMARVRWHDGATAANWICSTPVNPLRSATSTLRGSSTSHSCTL